MKIGIISDTHGLLRPEVTEALQGCEAILHCGDIDNQGILDSLQKLAPVYAVRGNCDFFRADHLPYFLDFKLAGIRIYMTHRMFDLPENLEAYDLVAYGHSHMYEESVQGKTVLLNPGSCGPKRFQKPVTMAIADISEDGILINRIDLTQQKAP